jgi:predicted RNA binding protein YcfA (HicA-like mRNA interferase family)
VKALTGKEFCALLERHGWDLKRIEGSHHIYGKSGSVPIISVPVHGNKTLKIGLQRTFMRLADLSEGDL